MRKAGIAAARCGRGDGVTTVGSGGGGGGWGRRGVRW
jgi:hypothetical protein